ncbi:FBD protein [Medicago truncatula]|uniref:FBD protein n=1 Tax=Medicago truncatula TaxID=3880 RepID=G7J4I1_MEDTR|nr:FBD protein [Medicago truncatula]
MGEGLMLWEPIYVAVFAVEPPPSRTWQLESTTVFKCLKSHLNYVHIEGYQELEDEVSFAEYILRSILVLKKTMLIFVDNSMNKMDKNHSLKRLTNTPRSYVNLKLF